MGASASTTYSETVNGVTYTLDNVLEQKELVVLFNNYDFDTGTSQLYEKNITVCQIVANKSTMTVINNGSNAIYPGEVTYGIFNGGYIADSGGQICDEIIPGASGDWTINAFSHVEERPLYLELCVVDDPGLLQIPGEGFQPAAQSPRARIVTYLYRNAAE